MVFFTYAWTGPSNNPPNGNPIFWLLSGTNMYYNAGNVGIGTTTPSQKLTVAGTIESTSGGFKFPDGTTQTTKTPSFRGALVNHSTPYYITTGGVRYIAWDTEVYDTEGGITSGIHNNSTNSRLTVPAGVTRVRILANANFDGAANMIEVAIYKNGATFEGSPSGGIYLGGTIRKHTLASTVLNVVAGDYFEVAVGAQTNDALFRASITDIYVTTKSWFAMEIVE